MRGCRTKKKKRGAIREMERKGLTHLRGVDNRRREAKSQNREKWGTKRPRAGERYFCAYCSTSLLLDH